MRRERRKLEAPPPPKSFGEALRQVRRDLGSSLRLIATRARVSVREAARWEADTKRPSGRAKERLLAHLPPLKRHQALLAQPARKGDAMEPNGANGTNGHDHKHEHASAIDRLAYAKALWTKDPDVPIGGTGGMLELLSKEFGAAASIDSLQQARREAAREVARESRPLSATLGERAAAALKSMTTPSAATPAPPSPPSPGVSAMARPPAPDDRGPEAVAARRERYFAIAQKHPDWGYKRVQELLVKEMGASIAPQAAHELMAKARGVPPGAIKGRLTWKKAKAYLDAQARKNGHTKAAAATPTPAPEATMPGPRRRGRPPGPGRVKLPSKEATLQAIRQLIAAVPGIRSLTVYEDGSVDYAMREVVERKGRLKL